MAAGAAADVFSLLSAIAPRPEKLSSTKTPARLSAKVSEPLSDHFGHGSDKARTLKPVGDLHCDVPYSTPVRCRAVAFASRDVWVLTGVERGRRASPARQNMQVSGSGHWRCDGCGLPVALGDRIHSGSCRHRRLAGIAGSRPSGCASRSVYDLAALRKRESYPRTGFGSDPSRRNRKPTQQSASRFSQNAPPNKPAIHRSIAANMLADAHCCAGAHLKRKRS